MPESPAAATRRPIQRCARKLLPLGDQLRCVAQRLELRARAPHPTAHPVCHAARPDRAPGAPGYLTGPDDPLTPLLDRPALASELAVVVANGKIVGLVSAHNLARTVRQGRRRGTASTQPPG